MKKKYIAKKIVLKPLKETVTLDYLSPQANTEMSAQGSVIINGNIIGWMEMKDGSLTIKENIFDILVDDGYSVPEINRYLAGLPARIRNAWRSMSNDIKGAAISAYVDRE